MPEKKQNSYFFDKVAYFSERLELVDRVSQETLQTSWKEGHLLHLHQISKTTVPECCFKTESSAAFSSNIDECKGLAEN